MPSALIALCVTTLVVMTYAEPPINIGLGDLGISDGGFSSSSGSVDTTYGVPDVSGNNGASYSSGDTSGLLDGGFSDHGLNGGNGGEILATPSSKGIRYAGPIVYTNEKPPVIHFPPPPKPKKGGGYGKGGKGGKGHSIKYVPLPHHDLPVLIYQSDINPPIHVVHPPKGAIAEQSAPSAAYGVPQSEYREVASTGYQPGPPPDYGNPKVINGASLSAEYGVPQQSSFSSQTIEYGPPQAPSQPQVQYGSPKDEFEVPKAQYGTPKGEYGPPKAQKASHGSPPKALYGPPKKAASQPLPHIIYSGHPPIHIFQQPPIYMSAPKASSYGPPPKPQYGPPKSHGSSKSHSSSTKTHFGPPKGDYGPPKVEFHGVAKGDNGPPKAQYGPPKGEYVSTKAHFGPLKGDHGSSSKGSGHLSHHLSHLSSLKSHFSQLYKSHFSNSLSKLKSAHGHGHSISIGHGHGSSIGHSHSYGSHKSKANYIVAPKAWNRPPIIIYQGVRPPVHVYEKPNGRYADAGVISSSSVTIDQPAPVTHTVQPITLASPVASPVVLDGQSYSLEHAHVAGTDQAGNPAAQSVDLTYGVARISPEAGQLIDPRYKSQVAQARTIWVPNYGVPGVSAYLSNGAPQPAVYVSDLTSAGQQYQILRRNDILDESILSGISALRAEAEKTTSDALTSSSEPGSGESVQSNAGVVNEGSSSMQARIDVLPTFLATANEKTLNSIPGSYSSVIIPSASATDRSGEAASAVSDDPATNESTSKSS